MADQQTPTLSFSITVDGQDAGTQEFQRELVTIGTAESAVIRVDDAELAELHCAVQINDDGQVVVLDLGAEATFLNGEAINNAPVKDGDEIKIGKTLIKLGIIQPAAQEMASSDPEPIAAGDPGFTEDYGENEPVLDFIMRSGQSNTDLSIDRKAPKVLEVAEIWEGTVLNVRHFEADKKTVYIGDRHLRQLKVASAVVVAMLLLGVGFFMFTHALLPEPPRYPEGDLELVQKWNDEIAAEKHAIAEKKRKEREAELASVSAEADERIAKDPRAFEKAAKAKLKAELEEDPDSSRDLAHFQKDVRDELIDTIEGEREEAREKEAEANQPPDPYRVFREAWIAQVDEDFAKAMQRNREQRPLVKPNFDLFEKPDWEDFVAKEMMPIAEQMAATGDLRKEWITEFKAIDKEYDIYDDLDEKRVVEDLVLGTRIIWQDKVQMLIAGIDPETVFVQALDGSIGELKADDEVLLWAPTQAQVDARAALYQRIQAVLYTQGKKRNANRLKCDALTELLKLDEHKNDFIKNAEYSQCLLNKNKFDQAVEYFERSLENKPADVTTEDNAVAFQSALEAKSRILLRNAWRTEADADEYDVGKIDKSGLMPIPQREAALAAHNELREFLISHRRAPGPLKAIGNGIYTLEKERLKEKQQIQVQRAMGLSAFIVLLLPLAFGFDEVRSRKQAQDFFVDSEELPNNHFALLEQDASSLRVNFTSDTLGFVETSDGSKLSTADLVSSGRAKDAGGFFQVALNEGERFVNDFGHTMFFIHKVHRPKVAPAPFGKEFDFLYAGILGLLLFLGGILMIAIIRNPYDASQEEIQVPDRFVELMVQQVEKEKEKKKEPSGNKDAGEGAKAKDEEGKTGKKENKLKKAKGSKIAIQKSELDKRIAESTGLMADLQQMTDNSVFGTGGLDSSVSSALGGLIGSQYGDQYGSGGLGSRGSGFGGGGTAAGLGGLGTRGSGLGGSGYGRGSGFYGKKGGGAPGVGAGDPIILGALDKSIIDRIVKQHLPQIRYCYQKELNKNPKLLGKIVVKFVISKEGEVSSATTKSSTMKNPIVEKCINARFMRMRFPKPKGGGIVIVSYPFVFNSGG